MKFKFDLKVFIYTRPHLRDDNLEMELQMGRGVLESLFDRMEMREDIESLHFSFPENHLNIIEQRQIFERLEKYCPNLKGVTIKTHSVYIIQCTPNKCAYMMDEPLPDNGRLDIRHYHPMTGNLFDMKKINVLPGGKNDNE